MNRSGSLGGRLLLAWLAAVVIFGSVSGGVSVSAHGQHSFEVELFRGTTGPYELWITAVPLVGFLEIDVSFEPDAPEARLTYNPRVMISVTDGEASFGPQVASRVFLATANDYSAVFQPLTAGSWEVVVNIDSELGEASFVSSVELVKGRSFPWTALIAGGGLLIPIGWLLLGAVRSKRRWG